MEPIKIAALKNHLSVYLKRVRKGGRFLVMDRNQPVAKLVPIQEGEMTSDEERLSSLLAEGILEYKFSEEAFSTPKKVRLKGDVASQFLSQDRE